jgi:HD-like signal output (HDOD) protein
MKFLLDLQSHSERINFLEKEKLGFDYADLGASLLKKWNLSDFHLEIVLFHHKPKHSPNFEFESVHPSFFSDVLVNTIQLGSSVEKPFSSKLEEEAWENMVIPKKISLFDLKQKTHETCDETVSLFLQAN